VYSANSLGAFDIVTATGVLHHLGDPAFGLAQLCQVLKTDGIISV
jgi:2-polyprenyl-3-methyl-5-hydroxy-6-metoxy-1,4-benzoquinol methylase